MRKITQTIVGTIPPLDKNVIWLDSTDNTAPVEKVFINGQWTPMGIDTDDYYTKEEVNDKLDGKLDVIETPVNGNLIAMDSQGQATNSGKKIVDFIANPEVAGQNGEVLSVDSEGNPVWTTVTPTGTADTEMSDSSTNAVQNKVIKSYVDDNYAKKDGYYSQLTAGSAENLVGQTVDKDAYLIRPTATSDDATNEVANGVASVLGMEGNSAVWNQLLKQGRLVDMGLPSGLLWATSNIDITQEDGFAASPFQYGCTMFSWGNIEGHNTPASGTTFDYNWGGVNAQEPWYEGQVYGSTPGASLIANIVAGDTQDAARYNLGSLFKMPTSAQFKELFDNCDFVQADGTTVIDDSVTDKRVTINGIVGINLKSKVNGNLIFFSASGLGNGSSWDNYGGNGYYWSASSNSARYARYLFFSIGGVNPNGSTGYRHYGFAVRAVVNPNTVDDGHNNHRYYVDKDIIVDLTLLDSSNIAQSSTDAAVVKEKIAQLVGVKPYYAYNAGTILSAQTLGIKTYGQNLLNPTTKQAKLIPYTWIDGSTNNSNKYTVKNIPSGATATFTPDATGVEESVTITNNEFDITPYGSGILELSSATADTYVCMKWDEQKDDDVVPYEDHTYDFDVRKVYGKVNGAGDYVQCFPNDMKGAGSAHDILTASKAVINIGSAKLGDYNYDVDTIGGYLRFNTTSPISPKPKRGSNNTFSNQINSYGYINNGIPISGNAIDRSIADYYTSVLYIRDDRYSSAYAFKAAMLEANVTIDYELATPIVYTNLIYRDNGVDTPLADVLMNIEVNNWSMEEQLMTPYDNGNPTSIPATISTIYGMDAVEQIDTLNKTCYFAKDVKDNLQALLNCINTNCSETLGGTFSIGDPTQEDSKVFTFTFTENTEPDVEPTNEGE